MTEQAPCPDCGRTVWEEGPRKRIEAARDRDGEEAFNAWVQSIVGGSNAAHRELLYDLAIRWEHYCKTGSLPVPRELNDLGDGIWEFKIGTLRVPFFAINDNIQGTDRVTHGFIKRSRKAPRPEIRRALAIRREDLNQ